jgi:hypothetical protein
VAAWAGSVFGELGRPFLRVLGPMGALVGGLGARLRAWFRAVQAMAPPANSTPAPATPPKEAPATNSSDGEVDLQPDGPKGTWVTVPAPPDREKGPSLATAVAALAACVAWGDTRRDNRRAGRKTQPGKDEEETYA